MYSYSSFIIKMVRMVRRFKNEKQNIDRWNKYFSDVYNRDIKNKKEKKKKEKCAFTFVRNIYNENIKHFFGTCFRDFK